MFDWVLNIPLIFRLLREKLGRSLFHVKINSQLIHSSRGSRSLCNIYKSLDLQTNVLQCHLYCNIKLSLRLYLLQDEASILIKKWRSKRMHIQGQTPAKTLIIQFHLHLSTINSGSRLQDVVHLIYFYYQYLS